MKSFKRAAFKVLTEAGKPLHSKEITRRAINLGYLTTTGRTPEATMNALLTVDVIQKGEASVFRKTGPSIFSLSDAPATDEALAEKSYPISPSISSRQKGDIGEARIAELITLYGPGLACYKPLSDDEGVDIVVKPRDSFKTYHIQVKTRFGTDVNTSLIAHIRERLVKPDDAMGLVFAFFDVDLGDIWDFVWLVPAKDFVKLARISQNKTLGPIYKFIAGRSRKESNKWDKYLIDKRELGSRIAKLLA